MKHNSELSHYNDSESASGQEDITFDLYEQAQEALRMLQEAQKPDSEAETDARAGSDNSGGNTTYDLSADAAEALRRMRGEREDQQRQEASVRRLTANYTFGEKTVLQVDIHTTVAALLLNLDGEVTLGRIDNNSGYIPDIDLGIYGAYRLGISRKHAVLRRGGDASLELIDLGSRNGTHVNGERLAPLEPHRLKDGDEVRLGSLLLRLKFLD